MKKKKIDLNQSLLSSSEKQKERNRQSLRCAHAHFSCVFNQNRNSIFILIRFYYFRLIHLISLSALVCIRIEHKNSERKFLLQFRFTCNVLCNDSSWLSIYLYFYFVYANDRLALFSFIQLFFYIIWFEDLCIFHTHLEDSYLMANAHPLIPFTSVWLQYRPVQVQLTVRIAFD